LVRTYIEAETRIEADALEDIARLIVKYFPLDSGISHHDVVSKVIAIVEASRRIFGRLYASSETKLSAG
jgi:hypothetical protein